MQISSGGVVISFSGQSISVPRWRSLRNLEGASTWWDKCGIVDGYITNLDPDQGAIGQPDNSGARGGLYYDTGYVNTSVTVRTTGYRTVDGGGAPLVCINPDAPELGLTMYYEPDFVFGQGFWVLWNLGRQPSDISVISSFQEDIADGTPLEIEMVVGGDTVYCYGNGELKITSTIPVALQGSTLHGISIDVNSVPGRPANLPVIEYPPTVRPIGYGTLFVDDVWNNGGAWADGGIR